MATGDDDDDGDGAMGDGNDEDDDGDGRRATRQSPALPAVTESIITTMYEFLCNVEYRGNVGVILAARVW